MPVIFEQAPAKILEKATKEVARRKFFEADASTTTAMDPLRLHRIKSATQALEVPEKMEASWAVLLKGAAEHAFVEVDHNDFCSSQGGYWLPTHIYNFVNDAIDARRTKIRDSSISIIKFPEIQLTAIRVEDHDGDSVYFNALFRLVHKRSDFHTYDFKDFWAKVSEHRDIWREESKEMKFV